MWSGAARELGIQLICEFIHDASGCQMDAGLRRSGHPGQYNKVGVIKVGPSGAKNVLVPEPGTSAAGAYFVPLAQWIVSKTSGWQVWAVERRENLLEDQSELNLFKEHKATATQLFDYYLGYLRTRASPSLPTVSNSSVEFAKQWGMNVAVEDLHTVIEAAKKLGGKVVLGGHSLGGSVVTAYATWDFDGHAGADDLAGLVYIDGGAPPIAVSAQTAPRSLQSLDAPSATPWLAFGGIAAPYAGFSRRRDQPRRSWTRTPLRWARLQGSCPRRSCLRFRSPMRPIRLCAQRNIAPQRLLAAQAHLGQGIATTGRFTAGTVQGHSPPSPGSPPCSGGANTERRRHRVVLSPTLDRRHRGGGQRQRQPGASVPDVEATMGHDLPKNLLIYAFGAVSVEQACPRMHSSWRNSRASQCAI